MIRQTAALLFAVAIAAQAPAADDTTKSRFRAGDAIVFGTLKNLDYELVDDPDDLLGHGVITARLHVTRVVRGQLPSSDIDVKYFAHTYMAEGSGRRFHLRPDHRGFLICSKGEGYACR